MASQSESGIATRPATLGDIPEIVGILGAYREKLARWSPQFWRPAPGSAAMTTMYLGSLVGKKEHIFLVAEEAGAVIGFALALETPAPPVYAPGDTGTLDDFALSDDDRWEEVAGALLAAIMRNAKKLGWKQLIAVSPKADGLKNRLLEEAGLVVASQWWTMKL
ncbi:N-acetyltransferase family protein [Qipengyuania sp. RANM35]|uniref:GNAT family N-acetyltransferase n=1 Tax=Qipengyuania sp. RANM35 TaxID=3068635 RepID=UPI0034DB6B4B